MPRTRSLTNPVRFTLDGEEVEAEKGEPLAASLVAAGKMTIARSPKFHRPRGPACMRGACDGCLARVDETPNIMTCLMPAADGMVLVSQNRLGPRDVDLLRMTDWFFPDGMNHHELFAGVPGIQTIMQSFARRVAGLGRLPIEAMGARRAERRKVDAVVVGAGPSGMAAATQLARSGRTVEVLDDQIAPGGGMLALPADSFAGLRKRFHETGIRVRSRTTAGAVYGRDLLVAGEDGAEILEPRTLVLACGAHDGALAFEGNDVPGVMSARAAGFLLERGVLVGKKVVVVVPPGGGPFGAAYANAAKCTLVEGEPIAIKGTGHAQGVRVKVGDREKTFEADAVLVDAPRSPAFELCQQAGAELVHEPRGFVVKNRRIADWVWAVGEVAGTAFDAAAIEAEASVVD